MGDIGRPVYRIDSHDVVMSLGVEVQFYGHVAIVFRQIVDRLQFPTVYFLAADAVEFDAVMVNILEGPGRAQNSAQQAFFDNAVLARDEFSDRAPAVR